MDLQQIPCAEIPSNTIILPFKFKFCTKYANKSFIEMQIAFELKPFFEVLFKTKDTKIDKPIKYWQRGKRNYFSIDIYLPELGLVIEYDGHPWHKNTLKLDTEKNKILNESGVDVLRIREELPQITKDDIIIKKNALPKSIVNQLLDKINSKYQLNKDFSKYISKPYCQNGKNLQLFLKTIKGLPIPSKSQNYEKLFPEDDNGPRLDIPNVNVSFTLDPPPDPPRRFLKGETCLVCWGEDKRLCLCGPPIDDGFFEEMDNLIKEIDLSGQVEIRKRLALGQCETPDES